MSTPPKNKPQAKAELKFIDSPQPIMLYTATPAQLQAALFEARKRKLDDLKIFIEANEKDYKALGIEVVLHCHAETMMDSEGKIITQPYDFSTVEMPDFIKDIKAFPIPKIFVQLLEKLTTPTDDKK